MDPITLQVLTGALHAACEEMGAVLVRAAHSANIKERRDASTALFDPAGQMVMQAEHIPVHLGAMPAAVEAVLDAEHVPGRSWVLNDPYRGGTHLPDVTVITPAFSEDEGGELLGFAASRAHHADVGGRVPGSMPADSRTLEEEGVVIEPQPLDDEAIARLVAQMRQPDQRRADLRAQVAANGAGVRRLRELAEREGVETVHAAMTEVLDYAERRTRACLAELPDGTRHARDRLEAAEGDLELVLAATVDGDRLILDFAGSAAQHDGNLNCPLAVTRSAALFARAGADRSRHPLQRRGAPPDRGPRARGLPAQRPAAPRGGGRQRRDLLARGRPDPGRLRARAGPGDDEQRHPGQRRLHVLRDDRRRARERAWTPAGPAPCTWP